MSELPQPTMTATIVQRRTDAELTIDDGGLEIIVGDTTDDVRRQVTSRVISAAQSAGQTIAMHVDDFDGKVWDLLVHPDGSIVQGPPRASSDQSRNQNPHPSQRHGEASTAGGANRRQSQPLPGPARPQESAGSTGSPASVSSPESGSDRTFESRSNPQAEDRPGDRGDAQPEPQRFDQVPPSPPQPGPSGPWPPRRPDPQQRPDPQRAAEPAPGHGYGDPTSTPAPDDAPPAMPRRAVSFLPDNDIDVPANDSAAPVPPQAPPAPSGFFSRFRQAPPPPDTSAYEAAMASYRADRRAVSTPWPGHQTVAVVNGKGGSNKTPTSALLSAVFGRNLGAVLAWDGNETRGTLGSRTVGDPRHEATIRDLIPHVDELMAANAQLGQLARYVHHQPDDKFDVLRSNPALLAAEQRLTTDEFYAVNRLISRYYRLAVMDSGNDESTYSYLNMLDISDLIVVATTPEPDKAEQARHLLAQLGDRDARGASLADRAVIIISINDPSAEANAAAQQTEATFAQFHPRQLICTVPYDRGIREMQLRYTNLSPASQRAWLHAAALVARQLQDGPAGK